MKKTLLLRPEPDRARFYIAPHVRKAQDEDGLVLLDLRNGRYRTFNPLGSRIWSSLEEGYSLGEITDRLHEMFGAPVEVVRKDVETLVIQLLQEQLILETPETSEGPQRPRRRPESLEPEPLDTSAAESLSHRPLHDTWLFLRAWSLLVFMDLSMLLLRFPHLYSVLLKCRTAKRTQHPTRAWRICRAVDRAAASYFKRAWCLQRSATCTYLLRRNGYPANMVLGVRTLPFEAHAWVEICGRVVNDRPEQVERYLVLDRV